MRIDIKRSLEILKRDKMETQNNQPSEDQQLWQIAKARVSFKKSALSYLIVNLFLNAIWFFTNDGDKSHYYWPIWPMLGWGIGLVLLYIKAYHGANYLSTEKEYEQLKNKKNE